MKTYSFSKDKLYIEIELDSKNETQELSEEQSSLVKQSLSELADKESAKILLRKLYEGLDKPCSLKLTATQDSSEIFSATIDNKNIIDEADESKSGDEANYSRDTKTLQPNKKIDEKPKNDYDQIESPQKSCSLSTGVATTLTVLGGTAITFGVLAASSVAIIAKAAAASALVATLVIHWPLIIGLGTAAFLTGGIYLLSKSSNFSCFDTNDLTIPSTDTDSVCHYI